MARSSISVDPEMPPTASTRLVDVNQCWADTLILRALRPRAGTLVQRSVCDPEGRLL